VALRLADRWVWDSWYVWEGDTCHAFYLCASKGLADPNDRHRAPSIGHAISRNLVDWTILPDALAPSHEPAFDSWTTWTGSIVRADDGLWWMYYTGSSREDGGLIQTIGAATSKDLVVWEKHGRRHIVETDPRWYEKLSTDLWHDEAWRDPWVFRSDLDDRWEMLITARSAHGEATGRGVVGHAYSPDLANWTVSAPLSSPNQGFGQLEVIQWEVVDGVPLVIFCCGWRELSPERMAQSGQQDFTYSVVCPDGWRAIDISRAQPFWDGLVYAGRLVHHPQDGWFLLGFVGEVDGEFVGEIADPIPVTADWDRGLILR